VSARDGAVGEAQILQTDLSTKNDAVVRIPVSPCRQEDVYTALYYFYPNILQGLIRSIMTERSRTGAS